MSDAPQVQAVRKDASDGDLARRARLVLRTGVVLGIVLFGLLRLFNLTTDFPPDLSWDGDAYTDEGLYAHNAITRVREGSFYLPLDYNQFVALPFMPFVRAAVFSVFGVNLLTARLVSVMFALGLGLAVYWLVRRFESHWTAMIAVFVLALNHIVFAFSRLALDDVPETFLVTVSLACAVHVRGERWHVFAILTSLAFAAAVMTKTTAVFAVPLVAAAVILQELDSRRIWHKFLVCSATFLGVVGMWYVFIIMPHPVDFRYFFTLNLELARADSLWRWANKFVSHVRVCLNVEPALPAGLILMTPFLLFLSKQFRRHPLFHLGACWVFLYLALFAYYGRIYPRFFVMLVPPLAIVTAVALRTAFELRGFRRVPGYFMALAFLLSSIWQAHHTLHLFNYRVDSFNEMAADIERRIEADPDGNRVIIGHTAGGIALRTNLIARNDRYSPYPMPERLKSYNPGWAISEGEFRVFPLDPYYRHAEYFDLHCDIELVASYDTLDNFRGHKMHLYKLTPRENAEHPTPFERAKLADDVVKSSQRPVPPDVPEGERVPLLGFDWERAVELAPFGERYIHRGAVLNNRLYISGGFNDRDMFLGDVWSSANGSKWRQDTEMAPWPARFAHAMVAHDGYLYVMGGYSGYLQNDVWRSRDGVYWQLMALSAPWEPRSDFQAISHDGALYVIGGRGKGKRLSDVWKSVDGTEWTLVAENAWPRRSHFAAASHRGKLIIAGGADFDFEQNTHHYLSDVWSSEDGSDWTLINDKARWGERHLMSMVSLGQTLFLVGGDNVVELATMRRETWVSADAVEWWLLGQSGPYGLHEEPQYEARINHVVLGKGDELFLIGGHQYDAGRFRGTGRYPGTWRNDNVWKSTGVQVFPEVP
jgi:hypothetical protein